MPLPLQTALRQVALVAGIVLGSGMAFALEPATDEKEVIKSCERKLCTMVLGQDPSGPDLDCDISKTWDRDSLKKGESASVSWGFGDARCQVDLRLSRADVVAALTEKKYVVKVPEHEVSCVVEQDGKAKPVTAKLAPKLEFKNGKAEKIWINLSKVDGPTAVKATVNLAASMEDTLGLFHKSMVKSVNKFIHKRCAQRYYADGRPKPEADERTKKAKKSRDEDEPESVAKAAKDPVAADAR